MYRSSEKFRTHCKKEFHAKTETRIAKNYCATNSGSPEVELRFCTWLILFKY
jgi:hypothetical protein